MSDAPSTWTETIEVSAIVLNPKNYRHPAVDSQEECFRALFSADKRAYMLELATDIAARGLDPSSLPIVEPVENYWRVLEGNRRISCIKAMANPALIPDIDGLTPAAMAAYRRAFEGLGEATSLPTSVLAVVTTDRDTANHWIQLRHLPVGSHKGAGTMLWDPEGRVRMEQDLAGPDATRRSASNTQAADGLAIVDGLDVLFADDEDMLALTARVRRNKLTTIGRLVIKDETQVRLGIALEDDGVRFLVEKDALRETWFRILSDAVEDRLTARRINNADDVPNYLDEVKSALPGADDRLGEPLDPRTVATPTTSTAKKAVAKRAKIKPPERKPFRGLKLRHASEKTKALLKEMQGLNFDTQFYSIAVLNRSLIDLFTWEVMDEVKPNRNATYLMARMHKVMALIEPQGTPPKERRFPLISNAMEKDIGDLAVDSMNGYMHRSNWHPTADIVRRQCEQYAPFLEALDEIVEQHELDQEK